MIKKGIILAGGYGTRLGPLTKGVNKQLLPLYDKPLIYYPLSVLMLAGISNILIITNKDEKSNFIKLLGDGSQLGIKITFLEQSRPKGLPDAFIIGKNFIGEDDVVLILGDNFFYGQGFTSRLKNALKKNNGATIFTYIVNNPSDYGILETNKRNKIKKIIEKPFRPKSNLAITGLYFFNHKVINFAKSLKPSKRNELEIVDLLNIYLKKKLLRAEFMGRGSAWLDTGNATNLFNASQYIAAIEERQGLKIACIEEIAYQNKWISKKQILKRINFYGKCNYSDYLKKIF
jgi:glucose-1-phosphate thymidylyltransferase